MIPAADDGRVRLEKQAGIALVVVDHPPVNALSQAVRQGILNCTQAIAGDDSVKAVIVLCAGRTFIAGADIREFGQPSADPQLPDVVDAIERLDVPVVAAIHGTALGGGFEVALGCHYRIATADARVGTPEVNLGIIPGAGGCYRLPRLVGAKHALSMITGGKPIDAEEAREIGAVDAIVQGDLRQAAKAFISNLLNQGHGPRKTSGLTEELSTGGPAHFDDWRSKLARERRGQVAPQKAVDAVEIGVKAPLEQAARECREIFLSLRDSRQAAALRHVFFAEREVSRVPGLDNGTKGPPVDSVAVIGAGAMGSGIAMCFANAQMPVTLVDVSERQVEQALDTISKNYEKSVAKGKMQPERAEQCFQLIGGATDYSSVFGADLIVEAVFEDMKLKKSVFAELDEASKPGTILATNTSYLDINEIASASRHPENVIGLHFFNPAHIMKLLEIVQAERTSKETLCRCLDIAKRIRKTGVVARVGFGFIGNRMLNTYRTEALNLALEGASVRSIDQALYEFGMPMGPLALMDLTGLEVNVKMRAQADPAIIDQKAFSIVDRLYTLARKGQRSGAGFYRYESGSSKPIYDPQVDSWIAEEAEKHAVERRQAISAAEIIDRCILSLANEGAKILEEGIALRAGDIDVAYIAGYGFPRHLGGPMCWAEQEGLESVAQRILEYGQRIRTLNWRPAKLLLVAADEGRSFDEMLVGIGPNF